MAFFAVPGELNNDRKYLNWVSADIRSGIVDG